MPKDYKVLAGKRGLRIAKRKPKPEELLICVQAAIDSLESLKRLMKNFIVLLILAAATVAGYSQVPPPINFPTNVTVDLGAEKFGLTTAAVTDGQESRAAIVLDYSATKNFYLRGEVQMGATDDIVQNVGVGLGFYKSFTGFRIFAGPNVAYNWNHSEFEASVGAGVEYQPFTDGVLQKWSVYSEFRLATPLNNDIRTEPPHRRLYVGVHYSF